MRTEEILLLIDLDLQLALRTIDDKRAVVFIAEALQQLVQVIRNDNILIQHKGIFFRLRFRLQR